MTYTGYQLDLADFRITESRSPDIRQKEDPNHGDVRP